MEMNDILNGLSSCEDECCDSMPDNCTSNFGGIGNGFFPGACGQGNNGCGFGSWIWILLILFYCGCGRKNYGGRQRCCKEKDSCDNGYGGGILGNCSSYLFLLVILFLCNSSNNNRNISCGTGCC